MRSIVCVCASSLALLLLRAVRSLLKSRHQCDIYRGLPNDLGDCRAHTQTHAHADTQEQTSVNWRQSRAVVDWERQRKKPRCWWGRYQQKKVAQEHGANSAAAGTEQPIFSAWYYLRLLGCLPALFHLLLGGGQINTSFWSPSLWNCAGIFKWQGNGKRCSGYCRRLAILHTLEPLARNQL